ncbi:MULTISPECIES: type II secretion system protein GspM [unclassified Variovorax]|uniref:type II secretion system protein GspM n=1 Tax=unclassified Variovorax TaxID=663243 RepID=UPI003F45C794
MSGRWAALRLRLRAVAQPRLAPLQNRWRGLSQRERRQAAWMVVALTLALAWLLLAKPALDTLAHWDNELPRLRSQAAALTEVLADGRSGTTPSNASLAPAERVRASLDAAGLQGAYRLREAGSAWHVEFAVSTDASQALAWLLGAPIPLGMKVRHVVLQRSENGGSSDRKSQVRITATLVTQEQPGKGS